MPLNRVVYSVTDVNKYIKTIIENDQNLKVIAVKGEISNFKRASTGHFYFSLKDKESIISVCLWRTYAENLDFEMQDGDEVTLVGNVDVYPGRGTYSFIPFTFNFILEKLMSLIQLLNL